MAAEYKQNDTEQTAKNIDEERVYCTNPKICQIGRAVCIDLDDAMLPGNEKKKHMTILYRKRGKWSDNEIELISKETSVWLNLKYGSNVAPVTFTIAKWGNSSVLINGDLYDLCLYLRSTFNTMSDDEQRVPHAALFSNKYKEKYGNKGGGKYKDKGYDKDDAEKDSKRGKHGKHGKFGGTKGGKLETKDKINEKLIKMVSRMNSLRQQKQDELQLLDEQQKALENLLANSGDLDVKSLRDEIKSIALAFRLRKNEIKQQNKFNIKRKFKGKFKGRRGGKKGDKFDNEKRGKFGKHGKRGKFDKDKSDKSEKKELKRRNKEQRKAAKEERKRQKKEKLDKLKAAHIESLPLNKTEIGNQNTLNIYVDGYNIIGCDSLCRQGMRGKNGGRKASRSRLVQLLQSNFVNKWNKTDKLQFDYAVIVNAWFDGQGINEKSGDIQITFSTKSQIVDDKLVETFSKNTNQENSNILVITSDRELTLRLRQIGVKVMKSGRFYKSYLNPKDEDKVNDNDANNDHVDDEKVDSISKETNDEDDDFVKILANKVNAVESEENDDDDDEDEEDEDTPDQDENESDDNTPDEIEGDHDNDEEDEEFTTIFGETMGCTDEEIE